LCCPSRRRRETHRFACGATGIYLADRSWRSITAKKGGKEERMETLTMLAKASLSLRLSIPGILSLIAGILILLFPRLLNYLVAIYLIVVGLVLIFNFHL
jgi:hypothetical protein